MGYSFKSKIDLSIDKDTWQASLFLNSVRKLIYTSPVSCITPQSFPIRKLILKATCTFTPGLLSSCLRWRVCDHWLLWVSSYLNGPPVVLLFSVSLLDFGLQSEPIAPSMIFQMRIRAGLSLPCFRYASSDIIWDHTRCLWAASHDRLLLSCG